MREALSALLWLTGACVVAVILLGWVAYRYRQ